MFKMKLRRVLGLVLSIVAAGSIAVSCYDDSELRNSINDLKDQLSQLKTLVNTLQNDDSVTSVTNNADGSYTINFKKSGAVTIRSGRDGEPGTPGTPGKDGSIINVIKGEETYTFEFSDGTTIVLPRYSEVRVLSFEDADYKGASETTAYWTSLIDEPQYSGPILYGTGCKWFDDNNTFITASVAPYDAETWSGGFSGGGVAVSNYGNNVYGDHDYSLQLEVFNAGLDGTVRKGAGNNGSDNFAVIYDAGTWAAAPAALIMNDGVARVIESAYVTNTCYVLNTLINGNDYCAPVADDGFFKIVATGYAGEEVTGTSEFFLVNKNEFVTDWTKWELSSLGAVDKIVFAISGSSELYGEWGFNAPAYFAIDDIAVKVYPE